jgi:MFS family permease
MVPMSLFEDRAFAAANASVFLMAASLFSAVFFIAQYLQLSLGYSPLGAGLRFLPWTLALFVVAPIAGSLADRIGSRWLVTVGLALQGAGLGWIALNADHDRPYSASVVALVLSGIGTCMVLPSGQNAVMNAAPPTALGQASGIFNTLRQLGGVFGVAILAAVFAANGGYASATDFRHGVAPAIAVAAGLALLGALIGLAIPERARPAEPVSEPVLVDAHVG